MAGAHHAEGENGGQDRQVDHFVDFGPDENAGAGDVIHKVPRHDAVILQRQEHQQSPATDGGPPGKHDIAHIVAQAA